MLERGIGGGCENCIDRNRMTLVTLAKQYVPGEPWIKDAADCLPGDYSLEAVHAIGRRIDSSRPHRDMRGPFLQENPALDIDENLLLAILTQLKDTNFHPDDIRLLHEIAQRRKHSFVSFLNRGKRFWDSEAEKAKPFLDQMLNRDRSEPPEKREIFQRVYLLDQGAFLLAKIALEQCQGMWFRMCRYGDKYQRFHIPLQQGRS